MRLFSSEEQKKIDKWMKLNKKTLDEEGRPTCPICMKPMVRWMNPKTNKLETYTFQCKCMPNILLSMG